MFRKNLEEKVADDNAWLDSLDREDVRVEIEPVTERPMLTFENGCQVRLTRSWGRYDADTPDEEHFEEMGFQPTKAQPLDDEDTMLVALWMQRTRAEDESVLATEQPQARVANPPAKRRRLEAQSSRRRDQ